MSDTDRMKCPLHYSTSSWPLCDWGTTLQSSSRELYAVLPLVLIPLGAQGTRSEAEQLLTEETLLLPYQHQHQHCSRGHTNDPSKACPGALGWHPLHANLVEIASA